MGKRIFVNDDWEEAADRGEVVHYGYYRRYRMPDGSVNPEFRSDRISGLILDLKEKKERGLNYFFEQLDKEICPHVAICVVPSHIEAPKNNSGISILARRLASAGRIDKVDLILREETIDKLACGGSRSEEVQRKTLKVNKAMSIEEDVVLIVDDVTTTGVSLKVCKELLAENGVRRIAMLALGKSI